MTNPSFIEPSTFFFQSKRLIYCIKFFYHQIKKKDSNYTNDVDANHALCCLMLSALRSKNIPAAVAATVAMSGSSLIGFLVDVAPTVDPSLIGF